MVICLKQDADLDMAQLMPLPLAVSCFSKIQIGFIFLVPAHPGSPGHWAVKWVCACMFTACLVLAVKNVSDQSLIDLFCQVDFKTLTPSLT